MGTRADFYVGRGTDAEWIGSIAWDGYPEGIDGQALLSEHEVDYRECVCEFFATRDDVTYPESGWPWPWGTSHTTDYAYAFDGDRVWISPFGHKWLDMAAHADLGNCRDSETEDEWEARSAAYYDGPQLAADAFPNMKERANVKLGGPRSGLIVVTARDVPS